MIFLGLMAAAIATLAWLGTRKRSGVADDSTQWTPQAQPENVGVSNESDFDAKIILFARAIAFAEGFGTPGAIPTKYHNPGDLKPVDGTAAYFTGQSGVGVGGHAIFLNDAAGWTALYRQVRLMATNASGVYNTRMTIAQVASHYAEDSRNWSKNVAQFLGVSTEMTLQEFFYGQ